MQSKEKEKERERERKKEKEKEMSEFWYNSAVCTRVGRACFSFVCDA